MHLDWHFILTQAPVKIVGLAVMLAPSLQGIKAKMPAVTGWKALALNFALSAIGVLALVDPWSTATWAHIFELTLAASGVHNIIGRFTGDKPAPGDPQPSGDLATPATPAGLPIAAATAQSPSQEQSMNLFATILGYAFGILPGIVTGVQAIQGDKASGASKNQMATDALTVALQTAGNIFAPGSTNANLAAEAGAATAGVISTESAIQTVINHIKNTNAISTTVSLTKATGAYQAATAVATATQTATTGAGAASGSGATGAAAAIPGTTSAQS
jgi:hypothetical protein